METPTLANLLNEIDLILSGTTETISSFEVSRTVLLKAHLITTLAESSFQSQC